MGNHADNIEISGMPQHTYEDYIARNMGKGHVSTTSVMIDLKGPNCYTSKGQILDTFTATMSNSCHEGSLAQTVAERGSPEERGFSGRPQQD